MHKTNQSDLMSSDDKVFLLIFLTNILYLYCNFFIVITIKFKKKQVFSPFLKDVGRKELTEVTVHFLLFFSGKGGGRH